MRMTWYLASSRLCQCTGPRTGTYLVSSVQQVVPVYGSPDGHGSQRGKRVEVVRVVRLARGVHALTARVTQRHALKDVVCNSV